MPKRRKLRKQMTRPEVMLWLALKNEQLGTKFRRQFSVGTYVIDFYCPALKIAVEADGESHFTTDGQAHDERRRKFIESFGIRILRFTNREIQENLDGVLAVIAAALTPPTPP